MVLGEKEGIQAGTIFWAKTLDREGNEDYTGFSRVVRVGPGGEFGAMDPTTLHWRKGEGRREPPWKSTLKRA